MIMFVLGAASALIVALALYIYTLSRQRSDLTARNVWQNELIDDLTQDLKMARYEVEVAKLGQLNAQKNLEMVLDPDPYLSLDKARDLYASSDEIIREANVDAFIEEINSNLNPNHTRSN